MAGRLARRAIGLTPQGRLLLRGIARARRLPRDSAAQETRAGGRRKLTAAERGLIVAGAGLAVAFAIREWPSVMREIKMMRM
jgi:hypothetical protein